MFLIYVNYFIHVLFNGLILENTLGKHVTILNSFTLAFK